MIEIRPDFLYRQTRIAKAVHIALLILITALVFSNTLDNSYHLDSVYRVQNNTEINEFWPPLRFFTDIRTGSTVPQIAEYRPLMPLSHSINNKIASVTGTDRLAGYHIGNIALQVGSAILVYWLFCLLIGNWDRVAESKSNTIHYSHQAFAAASIFAVHPIAGSAVNYIAARDLLLMVFFFMASMLTYFAMRKTGDTVTGWVLSLLLLSLAILSKQAAIVGFGLVFVFEWILQNAKLKDWRLWARTALFAIPTAAYFLLRGLWIANHDPENKLRTFTDFTYPLTMLDAHLFYYLRNFVWPFEMRALARVETIESILAPSALLGLIFIVGSLVVCWLLRKRRPLFSFAILAYWLLFALTSSIFPFGYLVTDYRQYLPLVFLSLVTTMLIFSWHRKLQSVALLSGLIAYFSVSSYYINNHWKTEESFWQQSVKFGTVALGHQNYGLAIASKLPELAEYHYLEAIKLNPFHIYANINLGMLHIRMGKVKEGLQRLQKTAAINPNWALAHYWLAEGLSQSGQKKEAVGKFVRAADMDPRSLRYQFAAARALQNQGNHSSAVKHFERIVDLAPNYKATEFWLGFAYQKSGQSENAIAAYNRFLQHNPDHTQAHFNLAYELMSAGDCQTATHHFNRVLELKPSYSEVHLHLSKCNRTLEN